MYQPQLSYYWMKRQIGLPTRYFLCVFLPLSQLPCVRAHMDGQYTSTCYNSNLNSCSSTSLVMESNYKIKVSSLEFSSRHPLARSLSIVQFLCSSISFYNHDMINSTFSTILQFFPFFFAGEQSCRHQSRNLVTIFPYMQDKLRCILLSYLMVHSYLISLLPKLSLPPSYAAAKESHGGLERYTCLTFISLIKPLHGCYLSGFSRPTFIHTFIVVGRPKKT